jgi:hypothetical protein
MSTPRRIEQKQVTIDVVVEFFFNELENFIHFLIQLGRFLRCIKKDFGLRLAEITHIPVNTTMDGFKAIFTLPESYSLYFESSLH